MPPIKYTVVYLSLLVALVLMILPLPDGVLIYRPNWVALVLIYWSMALPKRVGLWFAFFTGIILDTSQGTLLGQHTLALVVVIFLNMNFYQRIRVLVLAQQAVYVFLLLLINQVLVAWVEGILGRPTPVLAYVGAPFVGMLIWPWVFVVLRDLRRKAALS